MITAKNNIIVRIKDSNPPEYAILNPISGSFDILDEKEYKMFGDLEKGDTIKKDFEVSLLERGYIFKTRDDQEKAIDQAYKAFNEEIENSQVQLMLVPTYGCNLACTYCYQGRGTDLSSQGASLNIGGRPSLISKETVDAFFEYARDNFSGKSKKPFITLFGGEPLVNSPAQREIIEYIVDKCIKEDYEFSAVTNGYDFIDYIDILKKVKVKEIQFTLDGSKEVHDTRRATSNKRGTFDRIVLGIEAAVNNKMPVNLRSVVDSENIKDIVKLSEFLDGKGWLNLPAELFKTQIGRNYELFDCYAKPQHLMTQVELWGEFASLSKQYPVLAKFHRPDFKGIRHIVDTGEMYMASFDTCPAGKTEWVFDLYGNIYGCTASCGREEYLFGTYWPYVDLNKKAINAWQKRDVKSIPKCQDCKYDVVCGGGCGVVAANNSGGDILSPDCRPIQGLFELGVNHYIDEIRNITDDMDDVKEVESEDNKDIVVEKLCYGCEIEDPEEEVITETSCCMPNLVDEIPKKENVLSVKSSSCCTPKAVKVSIHNDPINVKTEGCIMCGRELVYLKEGTSQERCQICVQDFETNVKCPEGHYICDTCHSKDILGKVEQLLISSPTANPIELANKVFGLPGLNMHGPEYHSIVPAVIVAAYQNKFGKRDVSKINEAIKRGKDTKGGSCGFNGNCGSAVGSGIAASIIEGTTPMSRLERGNANRATGFALLEISKHGGPRCCKREAISSIESFMQITNYFEGEPKKEYTCKQYVKNKDCIGVKCPYFPKKK